MFSVKTDETSITKPLTRFIKIVKNQKTAIESNLIFTGRHLYLQFCFVMTRNTSLTELSALLLISSESSTLRNGDIFQVFGSGACSPQVVEFHCLCPISFKIIRLYHKRLSKKNKKKQKRIRKITPPPTHTHTKKKKGPKFSEK